MAPDGDFVVVWADGALSRVFAQLFSSNGSPASGEFQVNTHTSSEKRVPDVAVSSTGSFIVTWSSMGQDGDDWGIFGQHYASNGSALGTEFLVNTYTPDFQFDPSVAWTGTGSFVVAWYGPKGSYYTDVFGRRFAVPVPVPGCAAAPSGSCATPGKSLLLLKDKNEDGAGPKDKLVWKWLKGPATMQADFGDPTITADYDFCIYAGTSQALVFEANVPAGPPWEAISDKGYKYKDATAAVDGIKNILLKGGGAGKSKALVKGKDGGLDLDASTLPFDGAANVTVQLSNTDNGNCWQSTFPPASVKKNTGGQFKAKTP
jgi:hypothetical protein